MSYNFKETMNKPERLAPGHRMCAGCGGTIAVRNVLRGLHEGDKAVIGNATGCLEVSTFTYPYTAWEDSYIHNAFENAGATLSGVEGAYKALKRKGKLQDTNYKFITFGGDGGTYDIGLQSLSGAMERNQDLVYVCYDNGISCAAITDARSFLFCGLPLLSLPTGVVVVSAYIGVAEERWIPVFI